MKGITICAILLQLNWCYGLPNPRGVGAYAYQDTLGNRYGGTYGLDDKDIISNSDPYTGYPPIAQVPYLTNFADAFFPNYISNYDNVLQEFPTFGPPNFFGGGGLVPFDVMAQPNSAFAGAAIGPGYTHQVAAINPENDLMKNVDISNRFNDEPGNNKFYSVSSSSYSSSSNLNGQPKNSRGAETVVNNNGKITKYRVQS
ncbi:unnamed protein product [Leptosia nina]|uniref:Uncharacterized protein n=1 Tax=Leptosia nina TaxID=320188 RepID=A0AAV1J555_9NEOP